MNHNKLQRIVIKKNAISDPGEMFANLNKTIRIDIDLQNAQMADRMFENCSNLQEVQLTNSGNLKFCEAMFKSCSSLRTAPYFNTSNVENTNNMFDGCRSLDNIPIYDFSSLVRAESMFYGCDSVGVLPAIDFSNLPSCNLSLISNMTNLKKILITNFGKPNAHFNLDFQYSNITADELNRFFDNELIDVLASYPETNAVINVGYTPAGNDPALNVQAACNKGWNVIGALVGCAIDGGQGEL